jgi:hypothetical protein
MSKTSDIINLIRDVVNPIGLKVWKFSHPIDQEGVERIVLNSIPNNQVRAGSFKQNNDVVNVNIFVPKINGSPNSARIELLDNSIQNAIESFNGITTRVGYYYLDPQPSQTFNESDKETITNIRIEVTYT